MSDERDTRVEELRTGDQVRRLGVWFDVVKVRPGVGAFPITDLEYLYDRNRRPKDPVVLTGPYVAVTVDERGPNGLLREFLWVRGSFVAAECNPRTEGVPA